MGKIRYTEPAFFAMIWMGRSMVLSEPVIHIDDSDVVKPEGYHFESLGIVRDGSRSTPEKRVYCKGYHVTEAFVLTDSNHPVSIFSELHVLHEPFEQKKEQEVIKTCEEATYSNRCEDRELTA